MTNNNLLKNRIEEKKQVLLKKELLLQKSFNNTLELLQPSTMLKAAANDVLHSAFKNNSSLLQNTLAWGVGILGEKVIFRKSNWVTKFIGMFGVKNFVENLFTEKLDEQKTIKNSYYFYRK